MKDGNVSEMWNSFDSMPIGILLLAPDMCVQFWNKLLVDWTGIPREDIVGKKLSDYFPLFGSGRYTARILPVFEDGAPVIFSPQLHPHLIPSIRADGQKRIQQTIVTSLLIGDRTYALVSVQDVTELMLAAIESRRLHQQAIAEIENRKRIEIALQESSERIRSIVNAAVEAILVIDANGLIEEFNPAAEKIFGYNAEEIIGMNVKMLMSEPYHGEHDGYVKNYMDSGTARIIGIGREVTGLRRNGSTFPMRLGVSEMRVGDKVLFTGVLNDITEQKQLEEQLRSMAMKDGLTGISNRRAFDEALAREWSRMQREFGTLSVILIDIDHFKKFNDLYGHQEGDACLIAVAAAIVGSVHRPGDVAARYGGEEFVVLLPMTDLAAATEVAERIRKSVELLAIPHKNSDVAEHVTISLGVAQCNPDQKRKPEILLNLADQELYQAKAGGRNQYKGSMIAAAA